MFVIAFLFGHAGTAKGFCYYLKLKANQYVICYHEGQTNNLP